MFNVVIEVDGVRCLGPECKKCVLSCPIQVLGVKNKKITAARPDKCILCFTCKGACPVHLSVIRIEEREG